MQKDRQSHSGFTLIEILVVIAIIGMLAAILFPVLAKSRKEARRIACLSNLRQIGVAVHAYQNDYDGLLPRTNIYPVGRFRGDTHPRLLNPLESYGVTADLLRCPETDESAPTLHGYLYYTRFVLDLENSRNAGSQYRLEPQPGTVLVYCWSHLNLSAALKGFLRAPGSDPSSPNYAPAGDFPFLRADSVGFCLPTL